ncbi:hypothetical protein IVA79_17605 [Bradyrhizobium sp. 138]|uniref:hypothetical protein n=1 Tax=Bradyrhizobium sp. 138 TaxID=2782615 RepID=UPI001FF84FE3|nr:hypothetical protein [Bradyrhizobium sp. 138]MCK1735715.1 hypothetical protein [Bradyrhizobium sp. 138]
MASKVDGQLSFDLTPSPPIARENGELGTTRVLSLCAHRERRDDAERARYFSEIIKLADHLQRKA